MVRLGRAKRAFDQTQDAQLPQDGSIFTYGDSGHASGSHKLTDLTEIDPKTLEVMLDIYYDRAAATYRYTHRPTLETTLQAALIGKEPDLVKPSSLALLTMAVAQASLYLTDVESRQLSNKDQNLLNGQALHNLASASLEREKGPPTIESVQARLAQVHYLLSSAQPNRAWYAFGIVVQLTFAVGLHQSTSFKSKISRLETELRRRVFWCVYKTDKYLSIALGRPTLVQDSSISQDLPTAINDEDLSENIADASDEADCVMDADIVQTHLAKIVNTGIQEHYDSESGLLLEMVGKNNRALEEWRASLPPTLNGMIKPSSLIPVFRRQATVLKTFYLHAVMFINRPLLLQSLTSPESDGHQVYIDACVDAAKEIAHQAVKFGVEGQAFQAFWFTQNTNFNALSILYFYVLRTLENKSLDIHEQHKIFGLAEAAQNALSEASQGNAPSQRYHTILEELRTEVKQQLDSSQAQSTQVSQANPSLEQVAQTLDGSLEHDQNGWFDMMLSTSSQNAASSFWPQFDSLPFGESLILTDARHVTTSTTDIASV